MEADAVVKERYVRNIGTITEKEQNLLAAKSVCVIGCGGLGGGVIEGLARMGVGHITAVDCDVFDKSNLNRQVLSNEENIGRAKAEEAAEQMNKINSDVQVQALQQMLDVDSAEEIIAGHDLIVDALDGPDARIVLEAACEKLGLPLVHGAIEGWNGQVAVIMPGDKLLKSIYGEECEQVDRPSCPSFTPAIVSAVQVSEAVKVLLGKEETLAGRMLTIDLLNNDFEIIDV